MDDLNGEVVDEGDEVLLRFINEWVLDVVTLLLVTLDAKVWVLWPTSRGENNPVGALKGC